MNFKRFFRKHWYRINRKHKDDLSFIIKDTLNLYEHQSTFNPNMPLRGIFYFADLYRAYIEEHHLDVYSGKLLELPFPQYVVFYNGLKDMPDRIEQKFSDSFQNIGSDATLCLECTAIMLNINIGHNSDLFSKCQRLVEYSTFVDLIRQNRNAGMGLKDAVNAATDYCIQNNILADILRKNRAEVLNLILTKYDEKRHIKNEKRIAREEVQISIAKKLIAAGMDSDRISEITELSLTKIEELRNI